MGREPGLWAQGPFSLHGAEDDPETSEEQTRGTRQGWHPNPDPNPCSPVAWAISSSPNKSSTWGVRWLYRAQVRKRDALRFSKVKARKWQRHDAGCVCFQDTMLQLDGGEGDQE